MATAKNSGKKVIRRRREKKNVEISKAVHSYAESTTLVMSMM